MKIFTSFWGFFNIALLLFSQLLFADDSGVEYKIKAGYIYNFTKFITWPPDTSVTFNLCILGEDPFGTLIDPIEKRTAQNRPIKVLRLNSLNQGHHCHILYVNTSADFNNNTPVNRGLYKTLTVGENNEFAAHGGMIGFVRSDDKIRLQINLEAVKWGGLHVSAKLLEVAEVLKGNRDD